MMVTTQLSGVSNPFSLRLASDVSFGIVLSFCFVCLVSFDLQSAVASGNDECFTRDPGRVSGGEENRSVSDIPGLANAAKRRLRFDLLAHIAFRDAACMRPLGLHHARIDRVDTNPARAEFLGQRTRD